MTVLTEVKKLSQLWYCISVNNGQCFRNGIKNLTSRIPYLPITISMQSAHLHTWMLMYIKCNFNAVFEFVIWMLNVIFCFKETIAKYNEYQLVLYYKRYLHRQPSYLFGTCFETTVSSSAKQQMDVLPMSWNASQRDQQCK